MSAPSLRPIPARVLDQLHRAERRRDADRQVDQEDPVPADRLGQDAAGEQADRAAGRGDEAVDADRFRLIAPARGNIVTIIPRITAEASAPPTPWTKRAADQHRLALGGGADQRGDGEDRQAGQEDAPLADQVADPPGEQQQAAEGDQVGVDDPGEVALGEAEAVLDRGQGDVHDRRVEDDHQHPRAEHVQRQPAPAVACRLGTHASEIREGSPWTWPCL